MLTKDELLTKITGFYLASHDFNGFPLFNATKEFRIEEEELKNALIGLILDKKISLVFGDIFPNPHIKAFNEEPENVQIDKLKRLNLDYVCAYPSCSHLKVTIDTAKYQDRPFTLRLALGEPQLSFLSFDLSVLEFYRNDPRYYYTNNDVSGKISIKGEYYESNQMLSTDKFLLETFGFSYDAELSRAVAVFLRYLSDLTPQHQQIWNAKLLQGAENLR